MSHDNLVTGLVAAAPLLLLAAYWAYLRSTSARRTESSSDSGLIPLWAVLAALALLVLIVLFLVDAHVARGLLVALVPFAIFFGFWMFMLRRGRRPPAVAAEHPPGRPVVTQRSRRMALLPIVIVLGIFTVARSLIGH
jgi:L-asparagine transporter-like permease